jgi:hypothetical protein
MNKNQDKIIDQTAITWPLHAVSENRGENHFK